MKLIAAKGQLQMQAQSDDIEITADKNARFTAIKGKGLFNAKQDAGGAYIRIKGGKIELHAPGKVSIKGGSHDWSGPAKQDSDFPFMPKPENKDNWIELNNGYNDLEPVKGALFKLKYPDGTEINGVLDDKGFARVQGVPLGTAQVKLGEDNRKWNAKNKTDNPHAGSAVDAEAALALIKGMLKK